MSAEPAVLRFRVEGMDCADEVAVLKREVGPIAGGEGQLSFRILEGQMAVAVDPACPVRAEAIIAAVGRTGMRAHPWPEASDQRAPPAGSWQRWSRVVLAGASGLCTFAAFALHAVVAGGLGAALGSEGMGVAQTVPVASRVLYVAGILAGAWPILPKALFAVRRLRPDMNLLMTIAVAGALAIGEWFEAGTVSFLFAVSLALEAWSVGRARRAVGALLSLAPETARVRRDGREVDVPAVEVQIGAHFVVRPGERIPLDGMVVAGTSEVNQAPITGESAPVPRSPGETVFAGTINGDGALEVESTKLAGETTLARIVRMVGEAQSKRAPSEQWVERFARWYTPAILLAAAAVIVVPPLLTAAPWGTWIYRGLVLLIIGCPCALVISTPVSIVAALTASARDGILVKGGLFMEVPARLRAVALDKTGTLTWGRPAVVEIVSLGGHDDQALLERVAAIEARSEHPLARAIVEYARARGVDVLPAEELRIIQGKGATARVGGKTYWVGSHRYLEEKGQETPEAHDRLEALAGPGRSVVVVGDETHVCGFVALSDDVRPEARAAVQELRDAGIERVVILTGDNRATGEAIGRAVGVDEVQAELLPGDKVAAVDALVARYGHVAMVGDGVNDAPALARATLGVAMGAAGTDAAIETADVALMSDDLGKLASLIRRSRATVAVIRQNIGLSLAIKATFVVLTVLGRASLWAAIAADMGASLIVIFNGLRLLRGGTRR